MKVNEQKVWGYLSNNIYKYSQITLHITIQIAKITEGPLKESPAG